MNELKVGDLVEVQEKWFEYIDQTIATTWRPGVIVALTPFKIGVRSFGELREYSRRSTLWRRA